MVWLLALDATEQNCSVALANWPGQLFTRLDITPRKHAEKLLPMIDNLLIEAGILAKEIKAIAVSIGPGAFTGIRIACSIAQGLGFGLNCPLVPINSLEVIGLQAMKGKLAHLVLVALDARLGELYTACYSRQEACFDLHVEESLGAGVREGLKPIMSPSLLTPAQLMEQMDQCMAAGFEQLDIQRNNLDQLKISFCAAGSGLACLPKLKAYLQRNDIDFCGFDAEIQANAVDVLDLGWRYLEQGKFISAEDLQPLYLRRAVQK